MNLGTLIGSTWIALEFAHKLIKTHVSENAPGCWSLVHKQLLAIFIQNWLYNLLVIMQDSSLGDPTMRNILPTHNGLSAPRGIPPPFFLTAFQGISPNVTPFLLPKNKETLCEN